MRTESVLVGSYGTGMFSPHHVEALLHERQHQLLDTATQVRRGRAHRRSRQGAPAGDRRALGSRRGEVTRLGPAARLGRAVRRWARRPSRQPARPVPAVPVPDGWTRSSVVSTRAGGEDGAVPVPTPAGGARSAPPVQPGSAGSPLVPPSQAEPHRSPVAGTSGRGAAGRDAA
jgi:hypothetical protein